MDKTSLVRPIVDGAKVQLHCRPRRFIKTLNLSTLRYFFDRGGNYGYLFEGLAIAQDEEMMSGHQGKYPLVERWPRKASSADSINSSPRGA